MNSLFKKAGLAVAVLLFVLAGAAQKAEFRLVIPGGVLKDTTITGRVYVLVSANTEEPPLLTVPFAVRDRMLAKDLVNWKASDTIVLTQDAPLTYPAAKPGFTKDKYAVQALLDINNEERVFTFATGNLYSDMTVAELPQAGQPVLLSLGNVVEARKPVEHPRVREVNLQSKLLGSFYKRPTEIRASVIVPESYDSLSTTRFPVLYVIPGFGTGHRDLDWVMQGLAAMQDPACIVVVLDPECITGHHMFANSDNNGPRATSLVREFIPYLEQQFRMQAKPSGRLLFGHSSGAWSGIWLQLNYPEFFGGAWCTAPDPVDLASFYDINIYKPDANVFYTEDKKSRFLSRLSSPDYKLTYKLLSDRETVIGTGEQYGSYEATFSPRGKNGAPLQLWNRKTGRIDPAVAKAWERYDIARYITRNLSTLRAKGSGKIHVFVGTNDNYYLDRSLVSLKKSLNRLKATGIVKIDFLEGEDHFSLLNEKLYAEISREMSRRVQAGAKQAGQEGEMQLFD